MDEHTLLKPIKVGQYELPNRIFMAPMTRCRANNPENTPTPLMAVYYSLRASAGLIITEGSQISKQGVGYINTPGIHTQAQMGEANPPGITSQPAGGEHILYARAQGIYRLSKYGCPGVK